MGGMRNGRENRTDYTEGQAGVRAVEEEERPIR